ncbi:MAG: TM2 domain-containing protein [Candidatus Eisenbacteria bacterium]|nr:TM2 domain-containing protein [Candidatus Eisenbacteria bacterium]
MANVMQYLPELEGDEMVFVAGVIKNMTEDQAAQFSNAYRSRRKDPQTILLVTLLGFIGLAGIQRFVLNQVGMGLLYLFTWGICWIGTIIDLVNYRRLAFEYNQKQSQQLAVMLRGTM